MDEEIGEEFSALRAEIRKEFSQIKELLTHVGAKNDVSWISFAFTINYVLLGLILWRLFW
jgi:hypothetical protein